MGDGRWAMGDGPGVRANCIHTHTGYVHALRATALYLRVFVTVSPYLLIRVSDTKYSTCMTTVGCSELGSGWVYLSQYYIGLYARREKMRARYTIHDTRYTLYDTGGR